MTSCLTWNDLTLSTSFESHISAESPDDSKTEIHIQWEQSAISICKKPQLEISWALPLCDIEYEWFPSCGKNRALRIDWNPPVKTRISSGAPVFCFYNTTGYSRLTVALSDVLSEIFWSLGVHEEDGTLKCAVRIPLNTADPNCCYSTVLYRDTSNVRFAEALQKVSHWWETDCGLTPMPVPNDAYLPLYSAWYSFHQNTIAHKIEQECMRAAELGMNTIIVDDGWQTDDSSRSYGYCGDWKPAVSKIPDMRAHVEAVHALGMKYMLWYGVPLLGEWSEHYDAFKDMTLRHMPDQHVHVLDPRYPVVRQFLTDTVAAALIEWNLDGFKFDFIDSIFSSSLSPAPTVEMDYIKVEDATVRLMTDIMNTLKAIKPDILIEFRQSYIGPAMRTYGNIFRVTDCPADPLSNRVGVIDLRLLSGSTAVHSDMLMWHPKDRVENAARQLLGTIFGTAQISVKLDDLSDAHRRMLSFYLSFMAAHHELLHAPIDVESPQNLYPLVRTRLDDREAIALYDQFPAALSDAETIYLFNASASEQIVLRTKQAQYHLSVYDCTGQLMESVKYAPSPLWEISVPIGGMVVLSRLPADPHD